MPHHVSCSATHLTTHSCVQREPYAHVERQLLTQRTERGHWSFTADSNGRITIGGRFSLMTIIPCIATRVGHARHDLVTLPPL